MAAPDLIVSGMTVSATDVQVEITNQGTTAVTNDFWVDTYINPTIPPTHVNQTWETQGGEGIVWGVTNVTLAPGDSMILSLASPYYDAANSNFSGSIVAGSTVYAQVDSANANTNYGNVLETHEILNGTYNNIAMTTAATAVFIPPASQQAIAPSRSAQLPPR